MMFAGGALSLCMICVVTVHGDDDQFARFESRFNHLEHKVTTLTQQVAHQHMEMTVMRSQMKKKNTELEELRLLLKDKHTLGKGTKVDNRRFVLANQSENVAFFARLDKTELTGINKQQTILFDKVVLNEGAGYDDSTGLYTVPATGFYLMSVAIASDLGHSHEIQVALMKNNVIIARAHAHGDSGHLDQGGITIVEEFIAGDKVCLQSLSDSGAALYGMGLTSFSAVQIMFK